MGVMTTGQHAMDEAHYKCRRVRMERDKLKAINADLLAALEKIANFKEGANFITGTEALQMRGIARAAIAKHKAA